MCGCSVLTALNTAVLLDRKIRTHRNYTTTRYTARITAFLCVTSWPIRN
jgi:hypothetical protein